jgi:hypothetical protein
MDVINLSHLSYRPEVRVINALSMVIYPYAVRTLPLAVLNKLFKECLQVERELYQSACHVVPTITKLGISEAIPHKSMMTTRAISKRYNPLHRFIIFLSDYGDKWLRKNLPRETHKAILPHISSIKSILNKALSDGFIDKLPASHNF